MISCTNLFYEVHMHSKFFSLFALCVLTTFTIFAAPEGSSTNKKDDLERPIADCITKEHILKTATEQLTYESTTGTLTLKKDDGKDSADIFFTSYFLKDSTKKNRPIAFCFNGGPGSAAIWLHMGVLGPKRVTIQDLVYNSSPGTYQDNPYTLLSDVDLVFIDPVSTGYSKPAEGVDAKQFYGVEEDISANADFIRLFLTHFDRWGSPKFLIGESYGTLRVIGLAEKLHEDYFLDVNGLVLISSFIDSQTVGFGVENELSYVLTLPTLSATSWYHHKLEPELQNKKLQELLAEVEEFAIHDYATALLLGDKIDAEKRKQVAQKLASYTGLTVDYLLKSSLRIKDSRFLKELLRKDDKVIGRFDGRVSGFDLDSASCDPGYDPSLDNIAGYFTCAFQQYLRNDLQWKNNEPYRILNRAVHPWNWGLKGQPAGLGYLSVAEHLKSSMIKNPNMRLFLGSGYYDLATPYYAADYTLDHLQLNTELRDNIEQHYYEAGHMMYLDEPSLIKMKADLSGFIQETLKK